MRPCLQCVASCVSNAKRAVWTSGRGLPFHRYLCRSTRCLERCIKKRPPGVGSAGVGGVVDRWVKPVSWVVDS